MGRKPSKQKSPTEVAEELAGQIRHHRQLYYNQEPQISDAEFDALEDRLREIAPEHPVLAEVGAPTTSEVKAATPPRRAEGFDPETEALAEKLQAWCLAYYEGRRSATDKEYERLWTALRDRAADHPTLLHVVPPLGSEWPKAQHQIPMGSLNKVNAADELEKWVARCDELASAAEIEPISANLALTEKLDGISLELVYLDGRLESAITRGDGQIGELITANAAQMQGVPAKISGSGILSVRGEVILRKSDTDEFVRFKSEVDKRFSGELSLRNSAAGQSRAKDPRFLPGCRLLTVLSYDVEGAEGLKDEAQKIRFLKKAGFDTPSHYFGDLAEVVRVFDEYQETRRQALDYEIDGLVVRANLIASFDLLGELNNRPRAAVAFKFPSEMKISTLREIRWETGNSGRITPVAIVDPVRLAGAKVERASLHNLAKVTELGIGVGDQVLISRRNDVIPYVEKVEVKGDQVESAPETCGSCGSPVSIEGEYLVCRNDDCPAKNLGRLKTWIKHLGLLDWGEKTLQRLYEQGLALEPRDLYRLTVEDVAALDGYAEASATKLLEPLLAKRELPMATFIAALGIESVSLETAKLLVSAGYEDIPSIIEAGVETLAEIDGLGAIKAEKIVRGLSARMDEIERLAAEGVRPIALTSSGPLAGMSFCFSGSHSRPRKELQKLVLDHGGEIASSVKKGLTYLVLADPSSTSSKAQKARKLGTEIIDEAGLEAIIAERQG